MEYGLEKEQELEIEERVASNLPKEYKSDERMSELINRDEVIDQYEVSNEYLDKYIGQPFRVVRDIEIFTKLNEYLKYCPHANKDSLELEVYRKLKEGTLSSRGVFYSEGIQITSRYPELKYTSFISTINDAFTERYMLPIKFPDGDVFTYIGYDPNNTSNKYNVSKISTHRDHNWVRQGNLLGNLDSLHRYKGVREVFVGEGLFDAYQMEDTFQRPALALLGSKIYKHKQTLLQMIKDKYNVKFIYVPDFDSSGLDHWLINSKLWDVVFNFNEGRSKFNSYKDVDAYIRDHPNLSFEDLNVLV